MATAAAGRGGDSPPRDGSENPNNGNLPAGVLSLAESISDLNLGAPVQVNKFLSAKNSVELHKSRARRFFPNQSLPSVLDSEEAAGHASGPSTLTQVDTQESADIQSQGSPRSHSGRCVNWADIRSTPACQALADEKRRGRRNSSTHLVNNQNSKDGMMSIENDSSGGEVNQGSRRSRACVRPATTKEKGSHTSLYLNNSDLDVDLSVLHAPTQSHPFVLGQSSIDVGIEDSGLNIRKRYPGNKKRSHGSDIDLQAEAVPIMAGGSPVSSQENIMEKLDRVGTLINLEDDLNDAGIGIDRRQSGTGMFTPGIKLNGSLTSTNLTNYMGYPVNHMTQVNEPFVYYQEQSPIPPTLNEPIGNHLQGQETPIDLRRQQSVRHIDDADYTGDDEVDFDTQPEVKFCLDDVPVPDPIYVANTVPVRLHPLIIRNCKKDCRSWLWKSREQREVAIRLQAENEMNGIYRGGTQNDFLVNPLQGQPLTSPQGSELGFNDYYT